MPGDKKKKNPYGTTLLARDTPPNRKLFPEGPFGYISVASTECTSDGQCPYYRDTHDAPPVTTGIDAGAAASSSQQGTTPIHILIAAYRDRLCGRTLHNAFNHAANPRRLFIRVYDQVLPGSDLEDDEGCWERFCRLYNANCDEYRNNVQIVKVDSKNSKGPTDARSKLSALVHWDYTHRNDDKSQLELEPVQSNDFCMQIDSHMDFSDDFDNGLIAMHHRTQNDYAVLSTYVTDIEYNNKDPNNVPNLCMVQFTSSIRNWGTKECRNLVKPKLTNAMWGAGLSFHRCHAELNVPVDPYLDGVFDGEEGSRGIRFFTHGYDVYTPDKVLVTHDYHTHQGNPVVHTWGRGKKRPGGNEEDAELPQSWRWNRDIEQHRDQLSIFGSKRVNMLLGIGSKFDSTDKERNELNLIRHSRFGLGNKRSLQQARDFTGIDLLNEKMVEIKCGNLIWVPFEEAPDYGVAETLARGYVGGDMLSIVSPAESKVASVGGPGEKAPQPLPANEVGNVVAPRLRASRVLPSIHAGADSDGWSASTGLAACAILMLLVAAVRLPSILRKRKDQRHKN